MITGLSSYAYTWSIGVPGYNYTPALDLYGLVQKTRMHGLHLLQIADNIPLHTLNVSEIEKFKKELSKNKIKIEVGGKGLNEENLQRYISIAMQFNSRILRFVIDDKGAGYKPDLSSVISIIKNSLSTLEKNGIILAIENHDRFRAFEFARIIESISSSHVGICLDCANSIGAGEGIFEVVNMLAPYTVNLHLKDISVTRHVHTMGFDVTGVPFGKGIIPLKWILDKMPESCGTCILELWMPPEASWEKTFEKEDRWVGESIKYINKILK